MEKSAVKLAVSSLLPAVVIALVLGYINRQPNSFAAWQKQSQLRSNRERAGLNSETIADARASLAEERRRESPISHEGRKLLAEMKEVGARGDWQAIRILISGYTGTDRQVYSSAIRYAVRCGQFQAGAQIYKKVRNIKMKFDQTLFSAALLLFAKLGDRTTLNEIWAEACETCQLNEPLALARIDAASFEGDVETAARVLDQMSKLRVGIEVPHINAAIHTCAAAEGCAHNAAKFLFDMLLNDLELEPNIITFTSLMEAYHRAPLEHVLDAYAEMRRRAVEVDFAFAETYLCALLQKPTAASNLKATLSERSQERLTAARAAVTDFKKAGIKLTTLSSRIDHALQQLDFDE